MGKSAPSKQYVSYLESKVEELLAVVDELRTKHDEEGKTASPDIGRRRRRRGSLERERNSEEEEDESEQHKREEGDSEKESLHSSDGEETDPDRRARVLPIPRSQELFEFAKDMQRRKWAEEDKKQRQVELEAIKGELRRKRAIYNGRGPSQEFLKHEEQTAEERKKDIDKVVEERERAILAKKPHARDVPQTTRQSRAREEEVNAKKRQERIAARSAKLLAESRLFPRMAKAGSDTNNKQKSSSSHSSGSAAQARGKGESPIRPKSAPSKRQAVEIGRYEEFMRDQQKKFEDKLNAARQARTVTEVAEFKLYSNLRLQKATPRTVGVVAANNKRADKKVEPSESIEDESAIHLRNSSCIPTFKSTRSSKLRKKAVEDRTELVQQKALEEKRKEEERLERLRRANEFMKKVLAAHPARLPSALSIEERRRRYKQERDNWLSTIEANRSKYAAHAASQMSLLERTALETKKEKAKVRALAALAESVMSSTVNYRGLKMLHDLLTEEEKELLEADQRLNRSSESSG